MVRRGCEPRYDEKEAWGDLSTAGRALRAVIRLQSWTPRVCFATENRPTCQAIVVGVVLAVVVIAVVQTGLTSQYVCMLESSVPRDPAPKP